MSDFKTVIFEVDGVIANTASAICTAINLTLEHFGFFRVPEKDLKPLVYDNLENLLTLALKLSMQIRKIEDTEINDVFIEKMKAYFNSIYEKNCLEQTVLYPEAVDLLDFLVLQGKKLAAVSSKTESSVNHLLSYFDIDEHFSLISEWNSDAFNKILENTEKSEVLFAGCNFENLEKLKKSGFSVCLAKYGIISESAEKFLPDYSVSKPSEIKSL